MEAWVEETAGSGPGRLVTVGVHGASEEMVDGDEYELRMQRAGQATETVWRPPRPRYYGGAAEVSLLE